MRIACALIALAAMLADAWTTHVAILAGRKEGRRIMVRILGAKPRLEVAVAWRLVVWGSLLWVPWYWQQTLAPMPWYGWLVFASVFVYAAVKNHRLGVR